jgi:hypothetical protein
LLPFLSLLRQPQITCALLFARAYGAAVAVLVAPGNSKEKGQQTLCQRLPGSAGLFLARLYIAGFPGGTAARAEEAGRSAAMKKKTIFWLVLTALILDIIGVVIFAPSIASAASHCTQEQINTNTCSITLQGGPLAGVVIGAILWVISGILWFVAWIGALVRSAKMGSWVWFVIVLIFSGLGTLIYAIAGPPDRPAPTAYPPTGYPPIGYPTTGYPPAGYQPGGYQSGYPAAGYPPPPPEYPPGSPPPYPQT